MSDISYRLTSRGWKVFLLAFALALVFIVGRNADEANANAEELYANLCPSGVAYVLRTDGTLNLRQFIKWSEKK